MKKPAVLLSLALFLSACSLLDEGSEQPNNPDDNSAPTVQLTASPQSGPAPLTVNLNVAATDPEGDSLSYSWSLQGLGSASTATTVFNEAGSYPITVTVSDGTNETQASTTVTVTGEGPVDPEPPTDPTDPEPPTTEPEITIKASPGGPAPWMVRYDYSAIGIPEGGSVSLDCLNDISTDQIISNGLGSNAVACLHVGDNETVQVEVRTGEAENFKVLASEIFKPEIESTGGVPFGGTWKFTMGNEPPTTFDITEPLVDGVIGGSDATGTNHIAYMISEAVGDLYIRVGEVSITRFDLDLEPLEDGTQRFVPSDNWEGEPFILEKIN